MTKQENIAKINQLVEAFTNTKDKTELAQIIQEIVNISGSFKYEAKWRDGVMKIIVPGLASVLSQNIAGIADGTIEPLTDGDVEEALTELKNIAESTIDS